jgi:hypothetical protein
VSVGRRRRRLERCAVGLCHIFFVYLFLLGC